MFQKVLSRRHNFCLLNSNLHYLRRFFQNQLPGQAEPYPSVVVHPVSDMTYGWWRSLSEGPGGLWYSLWQIHGRTRSKSSGRERGFWSHISHSCLCSIPQTMSTLSSLEASMASQPLHSIPLQRSEPQYTIRHLGQSSLSNGRPVSTLKSPTKIRHHPYSNIGSMVGFGHQSSLDSDLHSDEMQGSSGPVRRRISRACDQCNQLRTKCDGRDPCAHCVGRSLLTIDLIHINNS